MGCRTLKFVVAAFFSSMSHRFSNSFRFSLALALSLDFPSIRRMIVFTSRNVQDLETIWFLFIIFKKFYISFRRFSMFVRLLSPKRTHVRITFMIEFWKEGVEYAHQFRSTDALINFMLYVLKTKWATSLALSMEKLSLRLDAFVMRCSICVFCAVLNV